MKFSDMYAIHLSFGGREWTIIFTCTPAFPIKEAFKLKRRWDRNSVGASSPQASRKGAKLDGF